MKKTYLLLIIFSLIGLNGLLAQNPGCDGTRYLDDVFPTIKKSTIVYAPTTGHLGQNINLAMDIYEPEGDNIAARPVVILAHGGSFLFGDKSNMQPWCEILAKKGYIAVSIQYRLYPFIILGIPDSTDIFDTAIKAVGDFKAAVRFFREDAATNNLYRADSDHIFIGGYSAGAVAAMHTAYLDEDDQVPTFLETLIANNGGLEGISGTPDNKTYASNSGAVVNMSGGLYRSIWVDEYESPLVSIHGTADGTVSYTYGLAAGIAFLEGSSLVHTQAETVGLWNNLLTVPGAGHTDLYEQAQWKPYVDSFWVNTSVLLESLTCSFVGTQEITQITTPWMVFPNPVTGAAGFTVQLPESNQDSQLWVYDAVGKVVLRINSVQNQQTIPTTQLAKGQYWLRMMHPEHRFEVKSILIP